MKRLKIVFGFAVVMVIIFFIYNLSITRNAEHVRDMIVDEEYLVVDTLDGSSGSELSEEKVEYLIGVLADAELSRKYELKPRGGWSYRLDIEADGEKFRVVFTGKDNISINGTKFNIDTRFE